MSSPMANSVASAGARRNLPATLVLGLAVILICEALLFADIRISGRGPMHTEPAMEAFDRDHPPIGVIQAIARCVSVNITPLAWLGYIVFIEGLLTLQTGSSPIRRRPHHFALLCLGSVFIWCVFDWVNFYSIRAWRYVGMPESFDRRAVGYLLAFGAIVPGMLMSGQALMNMRAFDWARAPSWRLPRWAPWLSLIAGVAMFLWPWFHPDPITNLTLWASLVFLLDPINYWVGRPSMWRDWERGWFGRTLACFAGGLVCGLLWEFWNYWALTKWIYRLPFLGGAEHIRYFEMPVLGLIGFLPFGLECWVMWQTIRIALDGLAEGLPDDRSLL